MTQRTILITQADSSIGREIAFALSKQGHYVISMTQTNTQGESHSLQSKTMELRDQFKKFNPFKINDASHVHEWELDAFFTPKVSTPKPHENLVLEIQRISKKMTGLIVKSEEGNKAKADYIPTLKSKFNSYFQLQLRIQ